MLTISLRKGSYHHQRQKMKSHCGHEEFLARIAKSLYYVELPLVNCTSLPVTELASEIFSEVNKFSLNRLDLEKAAHLSRHASVSPCLLVLALLYLERLKRLNSKYLAKVSPTELFLISLVVGSKFLQDEGEGDELSNTEWADLIGVSVQEINKAERQFLDAINWEVFVGKEEFWSRFKSLETNVGLRQGCKRGWFTYTELNLLLQLIDVTSLAHCLWNVTTACMISYTASVLALVGSALLVGQIPGLGLRAKAAAAAEVAPVDWAPASTAPLLHHAPPNVSNSLEFASESNATEPESVNLCRLSRWGERPETDMTKALSLGSLNGLYPPGVLRYFSPGGGVHEGHLMVDSSKDANAFFLLRGLNPWAWSDYIGNYLIKNSGNLYSVASL